MPRPDGGPPAAPNRGDLAGIYRAHARQVARWASRLGGPSIDGEDVAQEVFVKVGRHLHEFRGDAQITTWLYRITQNVVRHRRRKERWRRWLGGATPFDDIASPARGPLEELEAREATALVYRVLDGMRESYRTALVLLEIEGLRFEEVEALTGVRAGTLRVRLHRARADFAARVEAIERRAVKGRR